MSASHFYLLLAALVSLPAALVGLVVYYLPGSRHLPSRARGLRAGRWALATLLAGALLLYGLWQLLWSQQTLVASSPGAC